jgi:hypothetical protein
MAQTFSSSDFGVLTVPGAYPTFKVQAQNSGLATTGVLMLVGEATAGPDWTLESNLQKNSFGPDQVGDVIAKYGSGPIVDAVQAWASPANDDQIPGAPQAFIIVKTNASTQAKGTLTDWSTSTWGTLGARTLGAGANGTSYQVMPTNATSFPSIAEAVPTTGKFTMLLPTGVLTDLHVYVNGVSAGATLAVTGHLPLPSTFVTALNTLTGVDASGGAFSQVCPSAVPTLSASYVGNTATFTFSATGAKNALAIGDTLFIPETSALHAANASWSGSWVVVAPTAANGLVIVATKLMDASGTDGTLTPLAGGPQVGISINTGSGTPSDGGFPGGNGDDLQDFGPVTISVDDDVSADVPVDGLGKSLEIADAPPGSSPDSHLTNSAYALGTGTKVSWVSVTGAPALLTSKEYSASLVVNNIVTNTQEQLQAGGEVALQLGYAGTTCTVTVGATSLVVVSTGGANATTLPLLFKNFPSVGALAAYVNAQAGFSASASTGITGMLPATALDQGVFHGASTWGAQTCRIKTDAYRFAQRAIGSSSQVTLVAPMPIAGVPKTMAAPLFLSGGTGGGSTNAAITAGIDALQSVKGNFLVPLFSQDSAADITGGSTDATSSYDIANINAYAKAHVLLMSQPKQKKNRQALLSTRGTFAAAQVSASNIASFRCAMAFQDVQVALGQGIVQGQPWVLAGLAAAMQAAGLYKGIVGKYINCQGVLQAAGDYNDQNVGAETQALQAGLLPAANDTDAGGVYFVSDQTTYGSDSNFVYNSIQAVYVADTMALTMAARMQKAFKGQSVADISASGAVGFVKNVLADFLTQKLIAPSDGAPKGYKPGSIVVRISGTTMTVSVTVFLAGLIYFIPIVFSIQQVTQTASA